MGNAFSRDWGWVVRRRSVHGAKRSFFPTHTRTRARRAGISGCRSQKVKGIYAVRSRGAECGMCRRMYM